MEEIPGIDLIAELSQSDHVGAGEGDVEVAVTSPVESEGVRGEVMKVRTAIQREISKPRIK